MSLKYKGYYITARPSKDDYITREGFGVWQLELEKGNHIRTLAIGSEMTFKEAEEYAFNQIDKLVKEEEKR
jgi:hypothetical protein